MDFKENLFEIKPLYNANAKKSISSIALSNDTQNLTLREVKSLTHKACQVQSNMEGHNPERSDYYYSQILSSAEKNDRKCNIRVYETREVSSNQIFWVKEEMLTYRGKRYSLCDIATKWKKDCRMWLWKSNRMKNNSMGEIREKQRNV